MSWLDANELLVANTGGVYIAPVGTTLPDDPTEALDSAFVGVGYLNEDGATLTATPNVTDFMSWQSRQPVRRELTSQELQLQFNLQQWNEENIVLAFQGGEVTNPATGVYKYTPPLDGDALDERALVLDALDGDRNYRVVFPRGNVTDAVATNFRRSQEAVLPITFKALEPAEGTAPFYVVTDDGAFAVGS